MEVIHLHDALDQMDDRSKTFSVAFWKNDGNLVELENCVRCGIPPGFDGKKYIGARKVDNKNLHVYTIFIRFIEKFNGKKIFW
jgi:Zn ribbon nucleic-acid-binding protein